MCAQFLIAPHQAQGLFHRHFSKYKYAYDALGLLSEDSQGEEREVNKRRYIYIREAERGLK